MVVIQAQSLGVGEPAQGRDDERWIASTVGQPARSGGQLRDFDAGCSATITGRAACRMTYTSPTEKTSHTVTLRACKTDWLGRWFVLASCP
jgi:hypothetical protein